MGFSNAIKTSSSRLFFSIGSSSLIAGCSFTSTITGATILDSEVKTKDKENIAPINIAAKS